MAPARGAKWNANQRQQDVTTFAPMCAAQPVACSSLSLAVMLESAELRRATRASMCVLARCSGSDGILRRQLLLYRYLHGVLAIGFSTVDLSICIMCIALAGI